jgi:acetylornithine deacetylase
MAFFGILSPRTPSRENPLSNPLCALRLALHAQNALVTPLPQSVADIAQHLMSIDSTTGSEGRVIDAMAAMLESRGWPVARIPVSSGRDCLLARWQADPDVTFSTHLDTVPPFLPPVLDGDRLSGRGACDAKGIAASMVLAAEHLRVRGVPVALLFVVGEETTHDGARAANQWAAANLPSRPRVLINGEPTGSTLALGTKGAMRVVVRTTGRAAHSAYPELGDSAISRLVALLSELERLPLPSDPVLGPTTVNIGAISGGVADNVIAPAAEARLMARLVTPSEEVILLLQRWVAGRATMEQGVTVPPVRLTAIDGFPTSVAAFATDLPSLTNWAHRTSSARVRIAHTDDEPSASRNSSEPSTLTCDWQPRRGARLKVATCWAKTTKWPPGSRTPISMVP